MNTIKKVWKSISSMRFAIALLLVLAMGCVLGSLIPQGQSIEWYTAHYSENVVALILLFFLDDVFHSWWFIAIAAFLCLNLTLCNLIRLPELISRTKALKNPQALNDSRADATAEGVADPSALMKRLHLPAPDAFEHEQGRKTLLSVKNRIGLWGAWVCHLGILLLIAGFSLGQMTDAEYTIYGVSGQTVPVGDTGYTVDIDQFSLDEKDGMLSNYLARITVHSPGMDDPGKSAELRVNHPASLYGMKFYQNSVGRQAARLNLYHDGKLIQQEIVGKGDMTVISDMPNLAIGFDGFDRLQTDAEDNATGQESVLYGYSLYFRDINAGGVESAESFGLMNSYALREEDEKTLGGGYSIGFDEAQYYTLIMVRISRFTELAFAGGILVLLGLIISFYFQPRRVWAIEQPDGRFAVYGASRKGGALFREQFNAAVKEQDNGRK